MARRTRPVTQTDTTRLIKAALAAGIPMERLAGIKQTADGVVLLFGEQRPDDRAGSNEWDEVLPQ